MNILWKKWPDNSMSVGMDWNENKASKQTDIYKP